MFCYASCKSCGLVPGRSNICPLEGLERTVPEDSSYQAETSRLKKKLKSKIVYDPVLNLVFVFD